MVVVAVGNVAAEGAEAVVDDVVAVVVAVVVPVDDVAVVDVADGDAAVRKLASWSYPVSAAADSG